MKSIFTYGIIGLMSVMVGCAGLTNYERGMPKRAEIEVQKTKPPELVVEVESLLDGRTFLVAFEHTSYVMNQTVVYQTIESVGTYVWWGEFLEVPFGIPWMVMMGIIFLWTDFPDTEELTYKQPHNKLAIVFGPINPAQSLFFSRQERNYQFEEEMFKKKFAPVSIVQGEPVSNAQIECKIMNVENEIIGEVKGVTDVFGRLALPKGYSKENTPKCFIEKRILE